MQGEKAGTRHGLWVPAASPSCGTRLCLPAVYSQLTHEEHSSSSYYSHLFSDRSPGLMSRVHVLSHTSLGIKDLESRDY